MNASFKRGFIKGFKKLLRLSAIMAVVTFLLKFLQHGAAASGNFLNKLMLYIGVLLPFILLAALVGGLVFGWYAWKQEKKAA